MSAYTVIRSRRRTLAIQVCNGEVTVRAPYFVTNDAIRRAVEEKAAWIEKALAKNPPVTPPTDEQIAAWRAAAREYLPGRVAYYAALMGVSPTSVKVNAARRRWGSCSAAGHLNFSCRLMAYPPAVIDCVVVHELAHLRHPDHSKRFYDFVLSVMPDYRQRAALLKERT